MHGEANSETSNKRRVYRHGEAEIETIVPGDSSRIVLISTKSHGSDWDLSTVTNGSSKEECNGVESEDSGLQIDADSSKINESSPDMIVSSKEVKL